MANFINVSVANEFAVLHISTASITTATTSADVVAVPAMQNITLNNGNGVYRWKQLDSTSEKAISIAATNQISLNIVLDPDTFFGDGSGDVSVQDKGLFKLSNDKTPVYFRLYWNGTSSGDRFVSGQAYFTGLSPSVSADQPLWVSPLTLDVVGEYSSGTI